MKFKQKKVNQIQSQPTNLLQKRKNATLKGLETSKKITPEFEIPVEKYYIASLQNESTEKTAKKGRMWNTYHHQFTELLEALCSNQITLIHNQKKNLIATESSTLSKPVTKLKAKKQEKSNSKLSLLGNVNASPAK